MLLVVIHEKFFKGDGFLEGHMLGTALAAKQSVNVTEETIKVKEDNFGEVNDAVVGLATNWVE